MSTQSVLRESLVIPPVSRLVDCLTETASAAVKLERHTSQLRLVGSPEVTSTVGKSPAWIPPTGSQENAAIRKGSTFAIVVLVHAVVIYALSFVAPELRSETPAPIQVVSIEAPQSAKDTPPPPVPVMRVPSIDIPVEPTIDIAVTDSNAITVAPRLAEQAAAAATAAGVPKVVSSVEYLREPVAKYPPAARALKQRGVVMLRALIDANGHASEVNVHRSSGHRLLDDTARTAVLNALFKPYQENGHSIPVYVYIPIEFGAAG